MRKFLLTIAMFAFAMGSLSLQGQNTDQKATKFGFMSKPIYVPSIAQQIKDGTFKAAPQGGEARKGMPKHRGANKSVP
ncbi:MAG: hypothetical protein L3J12_02160, partial [Spirochaetales bacterium]|nr:hypothetical protein [Spirochaetales bacterium]